MTVLFKVDASMIFYVRCGSDND